MPKPIPALCVGAAIVLVGMGVVAHSFDPPTFGTRSPEPSCSPLQEIGQETVTDAMTSVTSALPSISPLTSIDDVHERIAQLLAAAKAAGAVPADRADLLHAQIARLVPTIGPDAVMGAQRELSEAMRRVARELDIKPTQDQTRAR